MTSSMSIDNIVDGIIDGIGYGIETIQTFSYLVIMSLLQAL